MSSTSDTLRPDKATPDQHTHLTAAARRARQLWPGPIGDYLAHDLTEAANWGYQIAAGSRLTRLAQAILDQPDPAEHAEAAAVEAPAPVITEDLLRALDEETRRSRLWARIEEVRAWLR